MRWIIRGFTLIELSIVLVIIGLIVAAVVGGQTLVKQARLRAIFGEYEEVAQAVNAFRLAYDGIPGDFDNAYAFWACGASASECNGDGDFKVEEHATSEAEQEMFRFWEHMASASVYPGSFTGEGTGTGAAARDYAIIGVNIPGSTFKNVGINVLYQTAGSETSGSSHNGNVVIFGKEVTGEHANADAFVAADLQGLDQKVDDGKPLTGIMLSVGSTGTGATDCVDTSTTPDQYNIDSTAGVEVCAVAFTLDKSK